MSTIAMIVQETCEVLWEILQPKEMVEPTTDDWKDIAKGFFEKTQFPNTVGAVSLSVWQYLYLICSRSLGYKKIFPQNK